MFKNLHIQLAIDCAVEETREDTWDEAVKFGVAKTARNMLSVGAAVNPLNSLKLAVFFRFYPKFDLKKVCCSLIFPQSQCRTGS
ncbi:MAG: hypothetical protein FWH22_08995 [Fibromonadales bacterium]|nr:hypothetical protein [Fibromonadales bacterium]